MVRSYDLNHPPLPTNPMFYSMQTQTQLSHSSMSHTSTLPLGQHPGGRQRDPDPV